MAEVVADNVEEGLSFSKTKKDVLHGTAAHVEWVHACRAHVEDLGAMGSFQMALGGPRARA